MGKKLKIKLEHLENGMFMQGLRVFSDRCRNYHIRLNVARLIRQIEKGTKDAFVEHQDLIRTFGTRTANGVTVIPAALTKDDAGRWEKEIGDWRAREVEFEYDGKDVIDIRMPKADLDAIPSAAIEEMMDYCNFIDSDPKGKGELETLRERVTELEAQVKASQGGGEG